MKTYRLLITLAIIFFSFQNNFTKPYVILVSFDGFRWDYLNRDITPNLINIKAEGVHAISLRPSFPSKTFPNHISIVTGMYPENHGVISNNIRNPFNDKRYKIGNSKSVTEPEWYQGEFFWETAERNGIKTASFFWPGSEISDTLRTPSIVKAYDHNFPYKNRIDTVIAWLQLPEIERPQFITLYFHETDSKGHSYGTESNETNNAISLLDSLAGYIKDQISTLPIKDSINIIFVSDHGMKDIDTSKSVNIEENIKGFDYSIVDSGPFVSITPTNKNEIKPIYEILKKNESFFKVYLKEEIPDYYFYNKHPFIAPIVAIADIGASLRTERQTKNNYSSEKATHGYAKDFLEMHGLFIANGPSFKVGMQTGTLWNIDIYPLLCEIFKISPRSNIDGKIDRIRFILKD